MGLATKKPETLLAVEPQKERKLELERPPLPGVRECGRERGWG
jgi:hypothetical protein